MTDVLLLLPQAFDVSSKTLFAKDSDNTCYQIKFTAKCDSQFTICDAKGNPLTDINTYALQPIFVNGYKIVFNDYWFEFQTSHDEIGNCESFNLLDEAIQYCANG